VCVIGSKSAEGGGLWHKYYALWLAQFCTSIVIDFYDYSEREDEWNFEYSGTQISCQWHAQGLSPTDPVLQCYDCVIDDIWTFDTGAGIKIAPGKSYSLKGDYESVSPYVPFLHPRETRWFSHPCQLRVPIACKCMVCDVCSQISSTYSEYLYARSFCARLGHRTHCLGISHVADLASLNEVHKELVRAPSFKVKGPGLWRFVLALTEEYAIGVEKDIIWRQAEITPEFKALRRFKRLNKNEVSSDVSYPWLEDRVVIFAGVHPSVLGATRIRYSSTQGSSYAVGDVLFASSLDVITLSSVPSVVYSSCLVDSLPGWRRTGRKVQDFFEFVRRPVQDLVGLSLKIGQFVNGDLFPPLSLFPFSDVSILGYPLERSPQRHVGQACRFFTFEKEKGKIVLSNLSVHSWRRSIWESSGEWGLLLDSPHLFPRVPGLLLVEGAISYPWDSTKAESQQFEGEIPGQKRLRELFEQKAELSSEILMEKFRVDGGIYVNLRRIINQQREFRAIKRNGKIFLYLTQWSAYWGCECEELSAVFLDSVKEGYKNSHAYFHALSERFSLDSKV